MININITFEDSAKGEILTLLDKKINADGLIVERANPNQKVLTFEGEEISINDFGGVKKGSEVFIKDNLISLMKLSKEGI
ncbi:MAG: hypothetical protein J4432_00045 [DPANN group archaeon]|nr:hypothetical protein [DPANN group archaeon]